MRAGARLAAAAVLSVLPAAALLGAVVWQPLPTGLVVLVGASLVGRRRAVQRRAAAAAADADVVVEGTPIDLKRIINVNKPIANIRYELEEVEPGTIEEMVKAVV